MKSAATFATILALSLLAGTKTATRNPSTLRNLRANEDTPTLKKNTDEQKKDHYHDKKINKIAISVPVMANYNTGSSSNSAVSGDVPGVVDPGMNPVSVLPTPTSMNEPPSATPTVTATGGSRVTPIPANMERTGPFGAQQSGAVASVPQSGAFGRFSANTGGIGGNFIDSLGDNQIGGFGDTNFGGTRARFGGHIGIGRIAVGQPVKFGPHAGSAFGIGTQVSTRNFGPGNTKAFIGGAALLSGNAFSGGDFNRRERRRRR